MASSQLSTLEIHKTEFQHRWLIEKFSHLLSGLSSSFIFSKPFPPENEEFQFSLRLQPNNVDENQDSFISIYLYLEKCKRSEKLRTTFRISILEELNDESCGFNVKESTENFALENFHGFSCFILKKVAQELLLSTDDSLVILCKVTIESPEKFLIETASSSSEFKAPKNVIKFTHKWIVNGFSAFYYDNLDQNQSIIYPKLDYASPSENEDLKFYIVLILNKNKELTQEVQKYISLYLYFESDTLEEVMVSYRLSILDWKNRFYVTGEGHDKLISKGDGKGHADFISCDELLDLRKGLLPKDRLTIFAQIEILEIITADGKKKNEEIKEFHEITDNFKLNEPIISSEDCIYRKHKSIASDFSAKDKKKKEKMSNLKKIEGTVMEEYNKLLKMDEPLKDLSFQKSIYILLEEMIAILKQYIQKYKNVNIKHQIRKLIDEIENMVPDGNIQMYAWDKGSNELFCCIIRMHKSSDGRMLYDYVLLTNVDEMSHEPLNYIIRRAEAIASKDVSNSKMEQETMNANLEASFIYELVKRGIVVIEGNKLILNNDAIEKSENHDKSSHLILPQKQVPLKDSKFNLFNLFK